jgi:hypothetical protein
VATNRVLLIDEAETRPFWLLERLAIWEAPVHFASSRAGVPKLLNTHRFVIVLTALRLRDASAFDLIPMIEGRPTDLFSYLPAGNGTWWLHLLKSGKECIRESRLQRSDFLRIAQQILNKEPSTELIGAASKPPRP